MKVCFVARPNFDKLSSHLYLALKQRLGKNFAAGFITCNAKESSYIKQSVGDSKVYQLNSFIEKHWDELSLEKLCKYEKKFQCYPIWEYIYTCLLYTSLPSQTETAAQGIENDVNIVIDIPKTKHTDNNFFFIYIKFPPSFICLSVEIFSSLCTSEL